MYFTRSQSSDGHGFNQSRSWPKARARARCMPYWMIPVFAIIFFLAPSARADLPGADSPKVYIDTQRAADELQYNRKRFIDTYNAVGRKNPKWDADAVAFLEQVSRYLVDGSLDPPFQPDDAPTAAQLARMGAHLVSLGCDDTQVRYGNAVALADLHRQRDAVTQFRFVFAHRNDQKLPPESVASTAQHLLKFPNFLSPEERSKIESVEESNCIEIVRGVRPTRAERSLMANYLLGMLDRDHAMGTRVCTAIRKMKDADPWMVEAVCGVHEVRLAWDARGADLAFKVTQKGWQGFATHLAEARRCLTKAWQMEPKIRGPAANMITVVMGDGGQGDTLRTWFDRALEALFDDRSAAMQMFWALRPRWGGSLQEMLALGMECAQTHRYDTTVPSWLLMAVEGVADETQDKEGRTWADPDIYRAVGQVLSGYEAAMPAGRRRDWFGSWQAAVAWRAGKFDDARRLLDHLTTPVAFNRFALFTKQPELMVGQVYAFSGPNAQGARQATTDAEAGRIENAAKEFDDLAKATDDKDKAAFYFDDYATTLQTHLKLDAGEWADLIPKRGVHGWRVSEGNWSLDSKGRLVGTSDQAGLLLLADADLGKRYEVIATMEYDAPKGQPGGVGLAIDDNGETYGNGLFFSTGYHNVSPYVNFKGIAEPMNISRVNTLHIQTWDGRFTATVNDKPVKIPEPEGQILHADGKPRLAIYSLYPGTDTTVYVTQLKVRNLKEQPASLRQDK